MKRSAIRVSRAEKHPDFAFAPSGLQLASRNTFKVAFFRGALQCPVPPGEHKSQDTRYLDVHEDDPLDEAQLAAWMKQASQLPGERI